MSWSVHPLELGHSPAWACGWGEDRFGIFVEVGVADAVQRMRWIAPGRFVMGSPESEAGRDDDEGPQHEVTLTRGFWLADTPCTQALWTAVMGENPSHFEGDEQRPVEQVSWDDCERFFARLEELRPGFAGRLPSEAEWEYACRAGTRMATYGGELRESIRDSVLDDIAWYRGNSDEQPHSVAGKHPNDWGLHDMLGNVWEWCADGWQADAYVRRQPAAVDPVTPAAGVDRVIRGGSWNGFARSARAAYRRRYHRGNRYRRLGFRLARGQERSQQD